MERLTRPRLIELCKKHKLPTNGLKKDLIQRLQNILHKKEHTIHIVLEQDGTLCHQETGLIIDKKTKRVIGRKFNSNCIRQLNRSDILLCKQYKFIYELPETLEDDRDDIDITLLKKDDSDLSDWDDYDEDENEEI